MSKQVEAIVKFKENLHVMRMNLDTMDEFVMQIKEVEEVIKKFASKKTKSYDFLHKAGDGYKVRAAGTTWLARAGGGRKADL